MYCQRLYPSTREKQTTAVGTPDRSTVYGERSTWPWTPGFVSKRRYARRVPFGRKVWTHALTMESPPA
jgi:hypothetical protein